MARDRGNPNWGKPEVIPDYCRTRPTKFDEIVQRLKLQPDEYASSTELRTWVLKNRHLVYIPEEVLHQFGCDQQPAPEETDES